MVTQLREIHKNALQLSPQDQLSLITAIWDSLAQSDTAFPDEEEALNLAVQRAREMDDGQVNTVSHENVMTSLDQVLNEARLSSAS